MVDWETLIAFVLIGIFVFILYTISVMGLLPEIATQIQNFVIWAGNIFQFDKIVNFIKELTHI